MKYTLHRIKTWRGARGRKRPTRTLAMAAAAAFWAFGATNATGDTGGSLDKTPVPKAVVQSGGSRPATTEGNAAVSDVAAARKTAPTDTPTTPVFSFPPAGQARPIDDKGLDRLLSTHGRRLLVVNFWATWCPPCVAEIPHFVEVANEFAKHRVGFVGLSADFFDTWEETVPPFLVARKVPYPNFVLDVDANVMIPKFSSSWRGSLPATFFYSADGRQLGGHFGAIEKQELVKMIRGHLAAMEAKDAKEKKNDGKREQQ